MSESRSIECVVCACHDNIIYICYIYIQIHICIYLASDPGHGRLITDSKFEGLGSSVISSTAYRQTHTHIDTL